MNKTKFVQRFLIILLVCNLFAVSGCEMFKDKPDVIVTNEKLPLALVSPAPYPMEPVAYKLVPDGDSFAFVLSEQSYRNLTKNLERLQTYIKMQADMILQYQNYYEPATEPAK